MEIVFDDRKAAANLAKHGISFDEAATTLFDPLAIAIEDPGAIGESRWVSIGMSHHGRLITVVYAYRRETIRFISARKSTRREAKQYA